MVAETVSIEMASAVNGHKSNAMALQNYAVGHQKRIRENVKRLDIKF